MSQTWNVNRKKYTAILSLLAWKQECVSRRHKVHRSDKRRLPCHQLNRTKKYEGIPVVIAADGETFEDGQRHGFRGLSEGMVLSFRLVMNAKFWLFASNAPSRL